MQSLAAKIPGVRAIDGGKLENARIVEQITALLIGLNIRHKGHSGIRITGLPPAAYNFLCSPLCPLWLISLALPPD